MKKILTSLFFIFLFTFFHSQWIPSEPNTKLLKDGLQTDRHFYLDISLLKSQLTGAQEPGKTSKPVIINLPTLAGKIERFSIYSLPVVVKELANQFQLGSYVGTGIDDPSKYVRFSLAPNDFQSMIIKDGGYEFIEPGNATKTIYRVYPKTSNGKSGFVCSTEGHEHDKAEIENLYKRGKSFQNQPTDFAKSSDRKYRTLRLAMSVTGEYTQFHGGTVAGALTAINATLTRVNGIFEKDFAVHLNLQNYPNLIYTNPATDPYSDPAIGMGGNPFTNPNGWSLQLKNILETNVGNTNYDIGHLFGQSGGGGMAGCIGCVCLDATVPNSGNGKGSAYTSPANGIPQGDTFDVDFVAHEMGHQLGGNHTFSYENQGAPVQWEPGSGSTIMAYAGIANANASTSPSAGGTFDIQPNSDAYFMKGTIDQVHAVLTARTCDIETPVVNTPPVIAALPNYTIPKETAFVLTASVTDAENDPMTYTWEQIDQMGAVPIDNINLGNTSEGASFRSMIPSNSPTRYFPKLSSVLAGILHDSNGWEAVSTVPRTTNFAITVRDNNPAANQQQTRSATQSIIVGNNGPFKVNSTTIYNNGPSNVVWDVANTNLTPYNTANVKIDFTTDNGLTWNVVSASTPNDGTESLDFSSFPLIVGGTAKIRISAINNVFYAVGSAPISTLPICTSNPPGGVSVTNITQTTATIIWNSSFNASYIVRYRLVGNTVWTVVSPNPTTNTVVLSGLSAGTYYEIQIANICSGVTGNFSSIITFMTPYCAATSSNTSNGYISNVTIAGTNSYIMSNNSGADTYTDYSADATKLITLVRNTSNNNISVGKSWSGAMSNKAASVWIDFNKNGIFEISEKILNTSNSQITPVNASFQVPAGAYIGPLTTRMRVILRDTNNSNPCGAFINGEVEDYAVKIIELAGCTAAAPSNISISSLTISSANLSWLATTGATYVLRYRKVGTPIWTTINPVLPPGNYHTISGLTEDTQYEFQVATICNGNMGSFSASQQFTTPILSYCPMTGTGMNEHISNVTVTPVNPGLPEMNNNSLQNNYTNYTAPNTLITLEIGSVNNKISVSKGWLGAASNTAIKAWIDFNRDGQFDNSEIILVSAAGNATPVTELFAVPANAYSGPLTTRMRVALRKTNGPVICQNITNGEVEDYAVKLRPCDTNTPTGLIVHTITHNSAIVQWTAAANSLTSLLQYRVIGGPTWTNIYTTNSSYTLNNLLPSTLYEIRVAANCGLSVGSFTPVKTFKTRCDSTPPSITLGNITVNSAVINWSPAVSGTSYKMRWRKTGVSGWPNQEINLPLPPNNTYILGNLAPYTAYEVQIASQCVGETTWNSYSNPVVFTTEKNCDLPPTGLSITQLLPNSAEILWDPFPGASYILRYRKVGIPSWTNIPLTTNFYTLAGLTELTKYEMQVVNVCNGTGGIFTPPYYFTTPTVTYCEMSSESSEEEYISKVTVKPSGKKIMVNASGASTYTDYSNNPETFIDLIQGSVDNEISIEKKWVGTVRNEGIAVWIDFNRNGDFDINERVFYSPPNKSSLVSGKFNVPIDAFVSMTDYKYVIMRIAMQRDGVPVNCVDFENGEVEDYSVRISKKQVYNPIDQNDVLIYPNPVRSILNVKNISKNANYKIYNVVGQLIADGVLLNNQLNVSKLTNGVYIIVVNDNSKTVRKKFLKE